MKIITTLLILTIFNISLIAKDKYNLSELQILNIKKVYNYGKTVGLEKTGNLSSLENTLTAIMLTESSGGVMVIGDDKLKNGKQKQLKNSSLGAFQFKLSTARHIIKYDKFLKKKYYYLLKKKNEILLINKLFDVDFEMELTYRYLLKNYNQAKKRHLWNPYFKAISRHNGGWLNYNYIRKVIKKFKIINYLKKENLI